MDNDSWNILIVDDEPDIHMVTELAIKRRIWRGRPIKLVSAFSGIEARKILEASGAEPFHVAIVDVVMETPDAGLQLCRFIREKMPLATRIILRTGQPGSAPEEAVLNDYDIDQYLAKTDATPERLFATLRVSLRSSQDVSTIGAFASQLRAFTLALRQSSTSLDDMFAVMSEHLAFLEDKHGVKAFFTHDVGQAKAGKGVQTPRAPRLDVQRAFAALETARTQGAQRLQEASPSTYTFVLGSGESQRSANEAAPPPRLLERTRGLMRALMGREEAADQVAELCAGFYVTAAAPLTERARIDLARDLAYSGENWTLAYSMFLLQDTVVQQRVKAIEAGERFGAL